MTSFRLEIVILANMESQSRFARLNYRSAAVMNAVVRVSDGFEQPLASGRGASLEGFDPLHADGLDDPSQLFDALAKPGELLVGDAVML